MATDGPVEEQLRLAQVENNLAEIRIAELEQALWECAKEAGTDLDGQSTPKALVYPDICTFAIQAVRSLREDYDAALNEIP